jgi:hypothetical protein
MRRNDDSEPQSGQAARRIEIELGRCHWQCHSGYAPGPARARASRAPRPPPADGAVGM